MPEAAVVFLEDIANKLDEASNDWRMFMHRKTGEFVSFQNDHLGAAEDFESEEELEQYSEWERNAICEAVEFLSHWDEYAELPSQYDIHEYRIMEAFAEATPDPHKQELLFVALSGKGAFRRFKDTLIRTRLEQEWYVYRFLAFVEMAREWCEDNEIAYSMKDEKVAGS